MASATWERRNARARAAGYRNYYDYRAHAYGRRPASEPAASGEQLARLRGHRGGADLRRELAAGRVSHVRALPPELDPLGRIRRQELLVTYADGRQRTFVLKAQALDPERLRGLVDDLDAAGIHYAPRYVLAAVYLEPTGTEDDIPF